MSETLKVPGLVPVGETPLLQKMVKEATSLSPSTERILDTAVAVRQEPDVYELAYMARELVQCTLPHKKPRRPSRLGRTNGNLSLGISPGWVFQKKQSIGFPYGSIPRLLICWINTEAVQTGKRRLELGDTFGGFVQDIGLNPNTGRGKKDDAKRLRDQMRRLFASRISFQQTARANEREAVLVDLLIRIEENFHPFPSKIFGIYSIINQPIKLILYRSVHPAPPYRPGLGTASPK